MVERERREDTQDPWIKYEYTGNFYSSVKFDQEALAKLESFIGKPVKPLIITDGLERIERFELIWTGNEPTSQSRPPFKDRIEIKDFFKFIENDTEDVLFINSQVLDGRIQILQRYKGFDYDEYKKMSTTALRNIIRTGIYAWFKPQFDASIKGLSFLAKRKKRREYKELWDELRSRVVSTEQ